MERVGKRFFLKFYEETSAAIPHYGKVDVWNSP